MKHTTELVFILDRSGSMSGLEADTIGGFNSMIARQKQAAGEELLLQGVVDCAFETPDGLVVVDFKTDRVTPQQQSQRAEGYRPQLEAYALALGKVLEKDVSEKLLYFFHTNSTVKL